jgi:penicillin-binding protein 1A
VVGVWVGNDNNSPMRRVVGGNLPASIWKQFITKAMPLLDQQGIMRAVAPVASTATPQPVVQTNLATRSKPETQPASDQTRAGYCDQQACASHYSSFRASDCTYQPYFGGPRRLCEINKRTANGPQAIPRENMTARAQARCNVEVCARTYSSFDPSDCSYQPFGREVRQLCEK